MTPADYAFAAWVDSVVALDNAILDAGESIEWSIDDHYCDCTNSTVVNAALAAEIAAFAAYRRAIDERDLEETP